MVLMNFAAGPAKLPEEVLKEVQAELLNYKGTEMSVMEMTHRGSTYLKIHDEALQSCRELL